MSQTIATASTVFAACDRLDAANERWNREDVRTEVGGGGYVSIDPLIKAWRALKPVREVAPTTPAELLHQVATSLDSHFKGFIEKTESQLTASQEVFDTTVSELSCRLAALESALEASEATVEELSRQRTDVAELLDTHRESLDKADKTNAQLVTENDGLRGQVARMEKEHKAASEKQAGEAKERTKENARERKRINDEHSAALAQQRQEQIEAAEQTENRLMLLLDQERQAGKESAQQLSHQLTELRQKAQTHREKAIDLEASMRQLTERNKTLAQDLAKIEKILSDLSKKLSKEQDRAGDIQRKFDAYKKEHKISGELSKLQRTVQELQAKLE